MNVLMPQLGETVAEGTVAVWHKKVGDRVTADELLFDVETDKASMEVPAPASGVLTQILVEAGSTVEVGTVLAVIESGDVAAKTASQPATASTPPAAAPAEPTTSAPEQPPERAAPPPSASTNDTVPQPALRFAQSESAEPAKPAQRSEKQRLSPAVRRLAAECRLDLDAIEGSGRNGRITRRNVIDFLSARQAQPAPAAGGAGTAAAAKSVPAEVPGAVPFSRIRRLTAEHMVRSKATSAHVLQAVEVDFHRVDLVRKSVRDAWKAKHGYSLTYLPFIAHAVCQALREFPNVNSSVQGDGLVIHEHVNLGIAIDLGAEGLVAPVIKDADKLSVGQLSIAINDLAKRARGHQLKPDDFVGGTYTLTNNGSFGTLITAPIINQPQVAILSTDGVRKKPVVIEGPDGDSIAIRPVGILAQSFDHRAIDGAYSGAFLNRLRQILEAGNWVVEV